MANIKKTDLELKLRSEIKGELIALPEKKDNNLSNQDCIIIYKHLKGESINKIANQTGYTKPNIHRILNKPEAKELLSKNRDHVYDELQSLGDRTIEVLREGLYSESESRRVQCALGILGKLQKPKDKQTMDDRMNAHQFLQQININNLQVVNSEGKEVIEGSDPKVIDATDNFGDN